MDKQNFIYVVNIMGKGLLQDQSIYNDFEQAKVKLFEYFEAYKDEFIEDGYASMTKFVDFGIVCDIVFTISMDEEFDEVRKYLNFND